MITIGDVYEDENEQYLRVLVWDEVLGAALQINESTLLMCCNDLVEAQSYIDTCEKLSEEDYDSKVLTWWLNEAPAFKFTEEDRRGNWEEYREEILNTGVLTSLDNILEEGVDFEVSKEEIKH